jgi:hypothetical protein
MHGCSPYYYVLWGITWNVLSLIKLRIMEEHEMLFWHEFFVIVLFRRSYVDQFWEFESGDIFNKLVSTNTYWVSCIMYHDSQFLILSMNLSVSLHSQHHHFLTSMSELDHVNFMPYVDDLKLDIVNITLYLISGFDSHLRSFISDRNHFWTWIKDMWLSR